MSRRSFFSRPLTFAFATFVSWPARGLAAEPPAPGAQPSPIPAQPAPLGQPQPSQPPSPQLPPVSPQPTTPAQPPPPQVPPPPPYPPPRPSYPPSAAEPYPTAAPSNRPNRQGFTLELGIGAALTIVTTEVQSTSFCVGRNCPPSTTTSSAQTHSYVGLAPLSIGIGGFVSPQVALLFRLTGSSYFRSGDQFTNGVYGGVVQYWPTDSVFVSAGGGVAVFGNNPLYSGSGSIDRTGVGLSVRAGLAIANFTHHSLRFAIEALPAFYDPRNVVGTTLVFEWQYF
jgi:hypothetical protein